MMSDQRKITNEPIRTFLCIEITDTIRERIAELQSSLKQIDAQVSWVKPESIHLTLKFLGGIPPSRIVSVCEAAARAASSSSPFEVEVSGTGCFPSARNPRVLWVGLVSVPDELHQLHRALEDELASEGFSRDEKQFAPHLTIGRIRSPRGAAGLTAQLIQSDFKGGISPATQVVVMRSDLGPGGAVYTPQAILDLGKER